MPMDASEREITADLISAVRTLATHVMALRLAFNSGLCARFRPGRARLTTPRSKLRSPN
jgi:hypothetical protein